VRGKRLPRGEQPLRQEPLPDPGRVGHSAPHRGSGAIRAPLGAALDEILPRRVEMQPADDRLEPSGLRDGLALVFGVGVPDE